MPNDAKAIDEQLRSILKDRFKDPFDEAETRNNILLLMLHEKEKSKLPADYRDVVTKFLALFIIVTFMSLVIMLCFVPIQLNMHDIIYLLIGSVATYAGQIITYYFGSSSGSARKDEVIAKYGESNNAKSNSDERK